MDWIRVDVGLSRHPKVGRLARRLKIPRYSAVGLLAILWAWVGELWDEDGYLECEPEEIAEAISWEGDPGELVAALEEAGWLDRQNGGWEIRGWEAYQSRDARTRALARRRKRKQRERERTANSPGGDASVTHHRDTPSRTMVTGCHASDVRTYGRNTDYVGSQKCASEANQKQGEADASLSAPASPGSDPLPPRRKAKIPPHTLLVDLWREKCPQLPQPTKWTPKRQQAWAARCRDKGFLEALPEVLDRISASAFCNGRIEPRDGRAPFRAHVDWLLRPDTWVRVLEGRYDDDRGAGLERSGEKAATLRRKIARLEQAVKRATMPSLKEQLEQELAGLREQLEKETT